MFFQKGKFYELYEDDARIGHQLFDLKLTDRVRMAMVGVPESSFDFWTSKFLAAGYKVGKVEQCETALGAQMAAQARGASVNNKAETLVRRELKSVLTNGTLVDPALLSEDQSAHCIAIKECRDPRTNAIGFGLTALDAATAEFTLAHIENDDAQRSRLDTVIRQFRPKEIVFETGNLDPLTMRLLRNIIPLSCIWTNLRKGSDSPFYADVIPLLRKIVPAADHSDHLPDEDEVRQKLPEAVQAMYNKEVAMESLGCMIKFVNAYGC